MLATRPRGLQAFTESLDGKKKKKTLNLNISLSYPNQIICRGVVKSDDVQRRKQFRNVFLSNYLTNVQIKLKVEKFEPKQKKCVLIPKLYMPLERNLLQESDPTVSHFSHTWRIMLRIGSPHFTLHKLKTSQFDVSLYTKHWTLQCAMWKRGGIGYHATLNIWDIYLLLGFIFVRLFRYGTLLVSLGLLV